MVGVAHDLKELLRGGPADRATPLGDPCVLLRSNVSGLSTNFGLAAQPIICQRCCG